MCKRVGKTTPIDGTKEEWFYEYTWTQKEQDEFQEWLSDFFKKREKRVILRGPGSSKRMRDKAAMELIFNYGWKVVG